jgi:hypothetical protein
MPKGILVSPTRLKESVHRSLVPLVIILAACSGAGLRATTSPAPTGERTVWPEEGPRKWAPRATEPAITANDLRTRLYQIADDSMSGRRIGEPGNYRTTEYIAREFKRLGLEPGGTNGSYFQDLPYGPARYDSIASRLIAGGTTLSPKTDWIPISPTGLAPFAYGIDVQNAPTVFAGRWGDTTVALDPAAFRGKVAVFLAPRTPPPPPDTTGGRGAGGRGGAPGGGRGGAGGGRGSAPANFAAVRDNRAVAAGVAALLVASLDSVPRNTANAAFNARSMMQPASSGAGAPGAAAISENAAARLFDAPLDQLTVGAPGKPVTARWNFDWQISRTPGRNVIAIRRGSDPARATQFVLVGAHNDHNGVNATAVDHDSLRAYNRVIRPQGANDPARMPTADERRRIDSLIAYARSIRPPRRDSIMNGADDDGSGTVVMMEIAERFATEAPARSIIFISHQGEEAGLLGSRWFVDHPTIPRDSIVAAHNMDMVGKGRVTDVKFGGPNSVQTLGSRRLSREFGDIIDSVNAISREPMAIDRSWDVPANPLNRFCRSDQVNYVRYDIPVTYFSFGYAIDYHQPTDEPQYIDYDHSARLGRFIHDVMTAIANRKDKPAIAGADPAYPTCR